MIKFAIEIIKKPPKDRIAEEVSVLIKTTENMPYFKELNMKNRHIRANTHEKICDKIRYEKVEKGITVMHYGDPATKFYLVLRGSVSIYVPRDYMVLQKELEENRKNPQSSIAINVLQKIFQWRAKLKQFVKKFPLEESLTNRKGFQRLYAKASVQLNPGIIKLLIKDLQIKHELFYESSVAKIIERMPREEPEEKYQENEEKYDKNYEENCDKIDNLDIDSPSSNCDEFESDFSSIKAERDIESHQDFLRGLNESERSILVKLQKFLGEVPLTSLDEPERYFQDGVFKFHLVGKFGAGNIFGEMGLLMRKPRSASVICNDDTDFAILTSEDYAEILKAVDKKEMESRMEFFVENLFQELQGEVAIRLSYMFKKSKYMKGNYIYKQGEKSNEVFLIKKGEIQIYKKRKEDFEEKKAQSVQEFVKKMYHQNENKVKTEKFIEIQLSKLGFGQFFGEDDIVYNRNRANNAVCSSNKVTLYYIPKLVLLWFLSELIFFSSIF